MAVTNPSKDASLFEQAPDTNYGASYGYNTVGGTSTYEIRCILHFDLTGFDSGKTTMLYLYLQGTSGSPDGQTYRISRVTQTGWVEAEVTWNDYKSSTAWTSAGGDYTDTDAIDFDNTDTSAGNWNDTISTWFSLDISTLADDAIDSRSDQLHIIIRDTGLDASMRQLLFYSRHQASYEPYVVQTVDKTVTDTVASVTETITKATSSIPYSLAYNDVAYVMNTKTGMWTYQNNAPFHNAVYRATQQDIIGTRRDTGNMATLNSGTTFDGTNISSTVKTGFFDFGDFDEIRAMGPEEAMAKKRLRAIYQELKVDETDTLTLTIYSEEDEDTGDAYSVTGVDADMTMELIRTTLGRDTRGKFFSFKWTNQDGDDFWLGSTAIKIRTKNLK